MQSSHRDRRRDESQLPCRPALRTTAPPPCCARINQGETGPARHPATAQFQGVVRFVSDETLQDVRFRRRMPSERPDPKAGCSAATLDATSLQDFPARGGLPRTCCTESGTPQCRRSCPQLLSGLGIDGRRCAATKGGSRLLDFRLCRAIWLTLLLTQGGSVSHARSWANREALPACDTYSPCLGGTSGIDAEACLARIISFWQ